MLSDSCVETFLGSVASVAFSVGGSGPLGYRGRRSAGRGPWGTVVGGRRVGAPRAPCSAVGGLSVE